MNRPERGFLSGIRSIRTTRSTRGALPFNGLVAAPVRSSAVNRARTILRARFDLMQKSSQVNQSSLDSQAILSSVAAPITTRRRPLRPQLVAQRCKCSRESINSRSADSARQVPWYRWAVRHARQSGCDHPGLLAQLAQAITVRRRSIRGHRQYVTLSPPPTSDGARPNSEDPITVVLAPLRCRGAVSGRQFRCVPGPATNSSDRRQRTLDSDSVVEQYAATLAKWMV